MDKVHVQSVIMKDGREITTGIFTTKEKLEESNQFLYGRILHLSQEKVGDVIDADNVDDFDDQYEDFLFNKELADQFLTIKSKEVPLDININLTLK